MFGWEKKQQRKNDCKQKKFANQRVKELKPKQTRLAQDLAKETSEINVEISKLACFVYEI